MQSPHRSLGPTRRSLLLGAGATALTTAAAGTLPAAASAAGTFPAAASAATGDSTAAGGVSAA